MGMKAHKPIARKKSGHAHTNTGPRLDKELKAEIAEAKEEVAEEPVHTELEASSMPAPEGEGKPHVWHWVVAAVLAAVAALSLPWLVGLATGGK